ncbi:MAG TPA: hypothetical protein VLG66_07465 [Alphaproteobacteria bacterium]|nr:hypothetical protein [Alphaproteobacteria bacterium]
MGRKLARIEPSQIEADVGIPPIVEPGEKVLVTERRHFAEDVRRQFAGVIERVGRNTIRIRGYLFVYDALLGNFRRMPEQRVRVYRIDNQIFLNVLPADCDVAELHYVKADRELVLTDRKNTRLEFAEVMGR